MEYFPGPVTNKNKQASKQKKAFSCDLKGSSICTKVSATDMVMIKGTRAHLVASPKMRNIEQINSANPARTRANSENTAMIIEALDSRA